MQTANTELLSGFKFV